MSIRHLRIFHPKLQSTNFFQLTWNILHKTIFNKFKKIEIIFSNHNGMKLEEKVKDIQIKNYYNEKWTPPFLLSNNSTFWVLVSYPTSPACQSHSCYRRIVHETLNVRQLSTEKEKSLFSFLGKRSSVGNSGHIDFPSWSSLILPTCHFLW